MRSLGSRLMIVIIAGSFLLGIPAARAGAGGGKWKDEPNFCDRFFIQVFGPRYASGRDPKDRRTAYSRGFMTALIVVAGGMTYRYWDGELPNLRRFASLRGPRNPGEGKVEEKPFAPTDTPPRIQWAAIQKQLSSPASSGLDIAIESTASGEARPGADPISSLFAAGAMANGPEPAKTASSNGLADMISRKIAERKEPSEPFAVSVLASDEAAMSAARSAVAYAFSAPVSFDVFYSGKEGDAQLEQLKHAARSPLPAGAYVDLENPSLSYGASIQFHYLGADGSVRLWRTVERSRMAESKQ